MSNVSLLVKWYAMGVEGNGTPWLETFVAPDRKDKAYEILERLVKDKPCCTVIALEKMK
jgi:hypothetical protein